MPQAFVVMPLKAEFDEIFNLFIADSLTEAGFTVQRADDLLNQRNILEDIVLQLASADLVVADLTGSNANVYYELGIAHALGRRVILLTQSIEELPFDLRPYRVISYNTHFAAIRAARAALTAAAKGSLDSSVNFGNPVTDFLKESASSGMASGGNTSIVLQSTDDFGLLDHIVAMEDAFQDLAVLIVQVGELTSAVALETDAVTKDITGNGSLQPGDIRGARDRLRQYAQSLAHFASELSNRRRRYDSILSQAAVSLEAVVTRQTPSSEEGRKQLKDFIEQIGSMEESAMGARIGYTDLAESLSGMPLMEQKLDHARKDTIVELGRFAESIDKTVAVMSRVRGIAERMLRSNRPDEGPK